MRPLVEVCVDNIESLHIACRAGADRIELCAALALGGITPHYGFIEQAVKYARVPIALMIRPRAGDFLFNDDEVAMMCADIRLACQLGIRAVVLGALTREADIDLATMHVLMREAEGLEVTFHRAFDLCKDPIQALEQLIKLGCRRVLTSGLAANAQQGIPQLRQLVQHANQRIQIMAGCGISSRNVAEIVRQTCVPEIHLSATCYRKSSMRTHSQAIMGKAREQDNRLNLTDKAELQAVLAQLAQLP